jgi:hypothetical protein
MKEIQNNNFYIIKDVNIQKFPFNSNTFLEKRNYLDILHINEKVNESNTDYVFDLYTEKESVELHKYIQEYNGIRQEYNFGISKVAAEKFPIMKLLKEMTEENKELQKSNLKFQDDIKYLKNELKISKFTIESYAKNKFFKILQYFKLV